VFYNGVVLAPILATKLYIPPPRPKVVLRPRLLQRLNEGLRRASGVTLISASAGFGKTTLVSEWVARCEDSVAWLSMDEGDNDPARFLVHLVAAVQTIAAGIGTGVMAALQSPQPPPVKALLTVLLNEITTISDNFILVLDDYHVIEAKPIDEALAFLVEHLPQQMHLVIATREDPSLPLARLRARGQLNELRTADLRFTPAEAAEFLNHTMGLGLSTDNIAALEARTEGWIAGLQLAALSMQGRSDTASFIESFTGSHHFVLDYLLAEVLQQQSDNIQTFLLRTSILDRLRGPLCEALLLTPAGSGQETLEYLERANLFIVPLDNDRQWYRYHHLFGDLLRKRLGQSFTSGEIAELHIRASQWYEDHGLGLEAFQHATAANDVERAERLMVDKGMPLHFRSAVNVILEWLASLPKSVLDARPALRVRSATLALMAGQTTGVEEKLQAAEAVLQDAELTDQTRNLIGQIACARATLALTHYEPEAMMIQSRRALEYLPPDNLPFRFTANWVLSYAYQLQGDRAAAGRALTEAVSISQASGDMFSTILALDGLGEIQEFDNQLYRAAETYRRVLQLEGDQPHPNAAETNLGLARIYYEWNDLAAAEQHGQQSLQLARQYDRVIDRFIISEVFLARLKLAQGDVAGAAVVLDQTDQSARQQNFVQRMPEIAAAQVIVLLHQGDVAAAVQLAQAYDLPLSRARVLLAQDDSTAALAILEPMRQQMEAKNWQDELLKVMILQAVALRAHGDKDRAVQMLDEALALAEPGGFIRSFVDEGEPMRLLIAEFRVWIEKQKRGEGQKPIEYAEKLLAAFARPAAVPQSTPSKQPSVMVEPLSERELEILKLIAQGLSNREISERLFLAVDTVKGHNRHIFDKLQVQRRTEAIARARELGLL
jgi:LuxR family transcriptional regulator, maltose regulon positive regulatory protein